MVFLLTISCIAASRIAVVDDFSSCTQAVYTITAGKPVQYIDKGLTWNFSTGPHNPHTWLVSFHPAKPGEKTPSYMQYNWDNRNSTWMTAACYVSKPVDTTPFSAVYLVARSSKACGLDITLVRSDKAETPFSTSVMYPGGKGWQILTIPFSSFSIPSWYSGTKPDTKPPPFVAGMPVKAVSVGPGWNSAGNIDICYIAFTNIPTTAAVKKKTMVKKKPVSFRNIKNYACYYGPDEINRLSEFDAVIIESNHHSSNDIIKLKQSGTIVIGYVTIGEDDTFHPDASWYFDRDKDGKPDKNTTWNSWFTDARSKKWREFVIRTKARKVIEEKGCNGIFLDTIDTVQLYPESKKGMIRLVRELREVYTNAVIVQNRGFDVIDDTAKYVDGIMFESFSIHYDFKRKTYEKMSPSMLRWTRKIARNVLRLPQRRYGLKVLSLDYAEPRQKELIQFAVNRADHYGYIPYIATIQLDTLFTRKLNAQSYDGTVLQETRTMTPLPVKGNLCRDSNVIISVDSTFPGYSSAVLHDGFRHHSELDWHERAWASGETPVAHEVQIAFDKPRKITRVIAYWAVEDGKIMASRKIMLRDENNRELSYTTEQKDKPEKMEMVLKSPTTVKILHIIQPKGKGPSSRPHLMWISEIEVY
jgi:uncharacterized protein (TIGR01370 family)